LLLGSLILKLRIEFRFVVDEDRFRQNAGHGSGSPVVESVVPIGALITTLPNHSPQFGPPGFPKPKAGTLVLQSSFNRQEEAIVVAGRSKGSATVLTLVNSRLQNRFGIPFCDGGVWSGASPRTPERFLGWRRVFNDVLLSRS